MLRPALGDLVLRIALPVPDPQLPEAVVDDRLAAEQRREGCRRLHGTSERARHKPVDRLLSKDVGDRRGGPHPSRLDALVEPTHRPALAVRGRAAVADQVDACHPSLLSVARACCSASPNGSRTRRLRSTNSPSNTRSHPFRQPAQQTTRREEPGHTPNRARRWISAGRARAPHATGGPRPPGRSTRATARSGYPDSGELDAGSAPPPRGSARARTGSRGSDRPLGGV